MIKLQTVSLFDLLPLSIRSDSAMAAAAAALDGELQETTGMIAALDIFGRSAVWTDAETDELAWQYKPPYYDPDLPLEQKRLLVQNAIPFHRHKGTPGAVEDLIAILFGEGAVEEWWQYGGDPYHFRVVTNNSDVTTTRAQEFVAAVDAVKRLSAVLDSVTISQAEELPLYFGGFLHFGETITI
ncbi:MULTISPECIES: phage tail protein I [unclassified Paenibacillus]|uniref:phage tail protein I n=1 Tax=unclassified Paenibacillus TaxID=185978 RepID=UPI0024076127|nr:MULTISPECIES: phage tail protein I [unclassified Paenibacillus]MDF9845571.1 phage tail P2-like protein [Paenibacillus sp. PastF-2]MDF9852145.1 phage tail P2-like protein [Paenibacillus sp. PastM-2]MDF9858722.1 phage tail P2-like protein [Paenibacillus sp. PastF-1]MDH6511360.1 phage tail P2-like protein [Paenibacillus sp. PastM-3]